jgi:ankyrin repeat protein
MKKLTIIISVLFSTLLLCSFLISHAYDYKNSPEHALITAIQSNNVASVTSQLKSGINPNFNAPGNDYPHRIDQPTPLMLATLVKNRELVNVLLSHKANVNAINPQKNSALICAASVGAVQIAHDLIKAGAELNHANELIMTPLVVAIVKDQREMVQLLIDNGADINHERKRWFTGKVYEEIYGRPVPAEIRHETRISLTSSPFVEALIKGRTQLAKLLLSKGASPAFLDKAPALESLNFVARKGLIDLVQPLVSAGVSINSSDGHGHTPLMEAARMGQKQMVELLLARGAGINAQDSRGHTALIKAIKSFRNELALLLIQRGADQNVMDLEQSTPLMHAAEAGNLEIVNLLVKRGADLKKKDRWGRMASRWAEDSNHEKISLLLRGMDGSGERRSWP